MQLMARTTICMSDSLNALALSKAIDPLAMQQQAASIAIAASSQTQIECLPCYVQSSKGFRSYKALQMPKNVTLCQWPIRLSVNEGL